MHGDDSWLPVSLCYVQIENTVRQIVLFVVKMCVTVTHKET